MSEPGGGRVFTGAGQKERVGQLNLAGQGRSPPREDCVATLIGSRKWVG